MIDIGTGSERAVKSGNTGGKEWQMVSVIVNGKTFSSFNPVDAMVNKGDEVEIEYEQKGKYNNIKTMTIRDNKGFVQASNMKEPKTDQGMRISKMAAINSAIALLELLAKVSPEKAKAIFNDAEPITVMLDIAGTLQKWVYSE